MVKKETSKNTLIIIKSVEEEGWPDAGTDEVTIPVLGTINKDGMKTSETDNSACESDATYIKSQPVLPSFEILEGHTTLTIKMEPDKVDSQDMSRFKDYVRGHDTYSGSLEFDLQKQNQRVIGASDGKFNPLKLSCEPWPDFRLFEIWTLKNPRDVKGNILMSLDALTCDKLTVHYGIIFDSLDESFETPNKVSVPISRRYFRRFLNHTFPTSAAAIYAGAAKVPGAYTPSAQPREQTRLNVVLDNLTSTGTLTVIGTNVFLEQVEEEFTLAEGSFLGTKYFDHIDSITVTGTGTTVVDVDIYDYDYALKNPELET